MPIYEYKCSACGHELEAIQKFSDTPFTECPQCGKPTLQKLISTAGFQLKGTGWYATDFKNPPKTDKHPASGTVSTIAKDGTTNQETKETKKPDKDDASS